MYIKKFLIITAIILIAFGGAFAVLGYRMIFSPNTQFEKGEVIVYVPTGSTYTQVREQLKDLIQDLDAFDFVANRKGYSQKVRPGKYRLVKGMNNNDLVNTLRSNNLPVNVTFNNQETTASLAGRIASQIEADSTSLVEAMHNEAFLKSLGLSQDQAISLYIPNTYTFRWNTSAIEFRDRMLQEYNKFWNESRRDLAKKQGLSPEQVMTLASIVHKETAKSDERPRVAGVYLNRLNRKIPLQADPTVIFAIKKETNNFNQVIKRVLFRDLELDSPFNTYKYGGLPPGPIFMPDISAIEAVLKPEKHDYLYFVADTSNFGYHLFAETLTQHNRNKAQYHRWINSRKIVR